MNKYETVIILDSNATEDNRNNAIEKIKSYIKSKGKIEKTEDIGKRKLAYEIRKNKEGYYYLIEFTSCSEDIAELERIYRITDEVIKFIVIKQDN